MTLSSAAKLTVLAFSLLRASAHAATCEAGTPNAMLQNASPKNWMLLALGGPTDVSVTGSSTIATLSPAYLGVSWPGNITATGASSIQTEVLLNTTGHVSQGSPSYLGPITQGDDADQYLSMARQDAVTGSMCAASLLPTSRISSVELSAPASNLNIAAEQIVNVVNLTDLILSNSTLTLSSHVQHDPPPTLIVNISGKFQMSDSKIALEGTLDEMHVLFNVTGLGDEVALSGAAGSDGRPTTQLSGILLAPLRNINLSSVVVNGTVLGGADRIVVSSGSQIVRRLQ
ncbi:MAG: hypothetical protein M3Z32_12580 [Acidobacteriota bacterium]|nr:hypothetical protein [Acidobacteriota bacterium]